MKRSDGREKSVKHEILAVVRYFSLFSYAPTEAQIHRFIAIKIPKEVLREELAVLVKQKKLVYSVFGMPPDSIYAMGGHSILFNKRSARKAQTDNKIQRLNRYIQVLYKCPWIRMIGISGSCSMDNAKANDDVDFFVISAHKRLWLARLWAITAAKVLRVHRSRKTRHIKGKACLNMFFDEVDMRIPTGKQNLYTAHEVAQMRLIDMRQGAYYHRLFIQSNRWILSYFPNIRIAKKPDSSDGRNGHKNANLGILGGVAEWFAKRLQLNIMSPHVTREIINDTQLWFFPRDYQLKITRQLEAKASRSR